MCLRVCFSAFLSESFFTCLIMTGPSHVFSYIHPCCVGANTAPAAAAAAASAIACFVRDVQDVKLDVGRDESLSSAVNEIAEIKSCNSCVFLECRKKTDLYLWAGKTPNGPSAK